MWIVLLKERESSGYRVHSFHSDAFQAKNWQNCKEFEGHTTAIAEVPDDLIDQLQQVIEESFQVKLRGK